MFSGSAWRRHVSICGRFSIGVWQRLEMRMTSKLRTTTLAVAALTASGAWSGCTSSPDPTGEYLADLLPIVSHGVSTDVILPSLQDSVNLLGSAWEEPSNAQQADEGLWVLGRSGTFRFYVAMEEPVTLEVEATALSTVEAPQGVEILLNGRSVDRRRNE